MPTTQTAPEGYRGDNAKFSRRITTLTDFSINLSEKILKSLNRTKSQTCFRYREFYILFSTNFKVDEWVQQEVLYLLSGTSWDFFKASDILFVHFDGHTMHVIWGNVLKGKVMNVRSNFRLSLCFNKLGWESYF